MLNSPKRTATQRGTHGAPPHPVSPAMSIRSKSGPNLPIPARLLKQPRYPSPDTSLQAALVSTKNEATKLSLATNYAMHMIGIGAPFDEIERRIQVPRGSLVGLLLTDHDRDLRLRLCGALAARAESFDRRAQKILAAVAGGAVRAPMVRAAMDIANSLRCMAEGSRRESEAYFRRTTLAPDKEQVRERRRIQVAWNAICGGDRAFLPGVPIVLSNKAVADPLTAAHEIRDQLQNEHDVRLAAGASHLQLIEVKHQINLCDRFIRSRAAQASPMTSSAAQTKGAAVTIP